MKNIAKLLVLSIILTVGMIGIVSADPDPCPAPNAWDSMASSSDVLVLQEELGGNLIKYYAKSTTDVSPSGGIPGFKEVCVLSSAGPGTVSALWSILGKSWGAGMTNQNVVEFNGQQDGATPGASGNQYNIPFDGVAHAAGTIQWNAVPQNIKTLVHINSPEICAQSADNDGDGNPETCFRRPPNPPGIVPELATLILTATGIIGLVVVSRKYRKN